MNHPPLCSALSTSIFHVDALTICTNINQGPSSSQAIMGMARVHTSGDVVSTREQPADKAL